MLQQQSNTLTPWRKYYCMIGILSLEYVEVPNPILVLLPFICKSLSKFWSFNYMLIIVLVHKTIYYILHIMQSVRYTIHLSIPINWAIRLLNMNSCLHLSNKFKECGKFLWIHLWNLCFICKKEFVFGKVAGCKPATSLNWTLS